MKKKIIEKVRFHYGGTWEIKYSQKTNFSTIFFLSSEKGEELIVKMLLPELFLQTAPEQRLSLAERFNNSTTFFREQLQLLNVPVPVNYLATTTPETNMALHIISNEGTDCQSSLSENPSEENARQVIRNILQAVAGVLHQSTPPIVGLDLQLANFSTNGFPCRYIDLFPPLCKIGDNYLVHEPQPQTTAEINEHILRKFSTPGMLRRLRFFVMTIRQSFESIFMEELQRILNGNKWSEVKNFFESLPDKSIPTDLNKRRLSELLSPINPNDLDDLRDIAMRVVPDNIPNRTETFERIFRCLRTPGPDDPPIDRIPALLEILSPFVD